jgi:hypothetical protein
MEKECIVHRIFIMYGNGCNSGKREYKILTEFII